MTASAENGKWLQIKESDQEGWVSGKYVGAVVPCPTASPTPTSSTSAGIEVGAWNLEHFQKGTKGRGFPEYIGAEGIPDRTDADYQYVADIIKNLSLKVLVLEEINGKDSEEEGDEVRSAELDLLTQKLGTDRYAYIIGSTGRTQRIAILYDRSAVFLESSCEAALPNEKVDGKSLFDREPLLAYFKVFSEGVEMNDFVVVGVHLASIQDLVHNHDRAMHMIVDWLKQTQSVSGCIPPGERDVIIAGDFNANRFDNKKEVFWDEMEAGDWNVLADDASYPATRLSGKPPEQRNSAIDYIIISKGLGGLDGEEVHQVVPTIHSELVSLAGGGMAFRRKASDHLPLSIHLDVRADTD